tara:strand:- start:11330 stop:13264 length:1935 start_codon:yes stop_codon:yes gene_type:complete
MPQLENNLTDDPIALDGDVSFSGGQASNVRKNVIAEGAFDIGKNVDFDTFGNATTRRGVSQLLGDTLDAVWNEMTDDTDVTGDRWEDVGEEWSSTLVGPIISVAYYDTPSAEQMILANHDTTAGTRKIKYVSETGSIADTGGTFDSTATAVYFAQLVDRMYFCDGVGNLQYVDSASAAQTITAGTISSIEITEQGLGYEAVPAITFSSGAAAATARLGYGGRVIDAVVDTPSSGYSATTPPTIAFAAGSADPTATGIAHLSQTPSKPKLLISHSNRLFCTSANTSVPPDTLYSSDVLDGESWDLLGNSIRVGSGDGDPITALLPWFEFRILVFKERSVWSVDANPAQDVADWEIKLINNRTGCVAHQTAQQVGPDVFFLSRDGVRSLSTIEAGAQTDISSPISSPINDYIERINKTHISKSCAVYYRNRYMLSVALDSATDPDTTLVFNAEQKSWSGFWVGWEPRSFAVTAFSGNIRLQFGDNCGKLYTWLDYVAESSATESEYRDQTDDYATTLLSRAYNFKEIYADKLGYQVEFDVDNRFSNEQLVSFFYLRDMEGINNGLLLETGDAMLTESEKLLQSDVLGTLERNVAVPARDTHFTRAYNMLSRGKFKEMQYMATTDAGKLSLHAVKSSAFADTIDPQR